MRVISTLEYRRGLDSINALTDNEVLHIGDTFDQEYIEFVLKKGIPNCVVGDSNSTALFLSTIPYYGLPLYAERDATEITNGIQFNNNISTLNCFNFMINKKQINRYLCIKFVEYFKLTNFN